MWVTLNDNSRGKKLHLFLERRVTRTQGYVITQTRKNNKSVRLRIPPFPLCHARSIRARVIPVFGLGGSRKVFRNKLTLTLRTLVLILCALSVAGAGFGQKGSRGGSSRSSSKSSSSKSSGSKTVHVKGYTRKDGTYVPPYDRSAPGSGSSERSSSGSRSSSSPESSDSSIFVTRSRTIGTERDTHGKIKRSAFAKHEFMASHPCPVTGRTTGKCPGYVIDHVNPLACGGPDAPSNMQWQTKEAAKAKDKWERAGCR